MTDRPVPLTLETALGCLLPCLLSACAMIALLRWAWSLT